MRRLAKLKRQREPTIALINIVFLMLVFFMVAGTLSQPIDRTMTLVQTKELEGRAPPDALLIHSDGRLTLRGEVQADAASYFATLTDAQRETVRLVPDRALSAETLVAIARDLRLAGAKSVMVVTERGLK